MIDTFSTDDLADLALQRSAPLIALGGRPALATWRATGDKAPLLNFVRIHRTKLMQGVCAAMANEIERLVPLLPTLPGKAIASIGAGLCLYELMLIERLQPRRLYVIDIEATECHRHGMSETGSGYSNNGSARRFLVANGVDPVILDFCNPRKQRLDSTPVDLIFSNLSMGFHYPCDEYVDFIKATLPVGGLLVFDKRRNQRDEGWSMLAPLFEQIGAIIYRKRDKVVCRRER